MDNQEFQKKKKLYEKPSLRTYRHFINERLAFVLNRLHIMSYYALELQIKQINDCLEYHNLKERYSFEYEDSAIPPGRIYRTYDGEPRELLTRANSQVPAYFFKKMEYIPGYCPGGM